MSQEEKEQSGLILWLSQQALPIRLVSFIVFILLIIGLIIGITIGLYYLNVSNFPRLEPFALSDTVTVAEYATFDDEATYPAALAISADQTLYTGSYLNGTIWRINSTGDIREIPNSREQIGSVIGIDIAIDGTIYVLDHLDAYTASGAKIWQLSGDTIQLVAEFRAIGDLPISNPNDIALDNNGRVFVLDIALGQIILLDGDNHSVWWQVPDATYQIAGLSYNPVNDSLLITDAARHAIYEIPVNAVDTEAERQTVFILMESLQAAPNFNGITVNDTGTIYAAALGLNEVWQIEPNSDNYTVLANNYRGSSDLAYDNSNNRLFVNNWDQSWLIPITLVLIQVDIPPRLPFSIDLIQFE